MKFPVTFSKISRGLQGLKFRFPDIPYSINCENAVKINLSLQVNILYSEKPISKFQVKNYKLDIFVSDKL